MPIAPGGVPDASILMRSGGALYFGGIDTSTNSGTNGIYIFDEFRNQWYSGLPSPTQGLILPTITLLSNGQLLCTGGETLLSGINTGPLTETQIYRPFNCSLHP